MAAAQYPPGHVLAGTVYRVIRHLATGGMGSVYDVVDTTVEKRYVLKTLHPQLVSREDLARRMRDEAKSLAKLQHPNIVDVITAGITSDAVKMPFYVMERLVGQNLRVVLEKKGALESSSAYRIAIDVADALEHAHENNIVHRDVKPENIFLHRNANGTNTTKLLDFGIVRLLDRKSSHTQGKFIGTLRYASPEQITGQEIGPATDLYSLGVVLYEMLAGRGPFDEAGDAYAIGAAHAQDTAPPISRFVAGVSRELEQLIASVLAKEPAGRPRDAFAFASELRRILHVEESAPRSATVVNVLSSQSPPTIGVAPTSAAMTLAVYTPTAETPQLQTPHLNASFATGPTDFGEPPSAVPIRNERSAAAAAQAQVAPTLAAAGVDVSEILARRPPPPAAGAPPVPGPSPMAPAAEPPRPVIDRNAPTRVSAPTGATRRIALNDTQLEVSEDALRAAFAEKAQLVAPHASGDPYGPELAFPPGYATGPLAGEARTRPPERGPVVLVAVAGGIALFVLVGAFAVRTFRTSSTSSTSSTSGATTPGSVAAAAPTSPPRATAPLEAAPPAAPLTTATLAAAAPTSPPPPAPSPPPPAPPAQRRAAEAPPAVPVVALKPAALRSRAAPTASGYSPAVKFE